MTVAMAIAALAAAVLLALVTFVQLLYLESLRLRARDFPSMRYFKTTLEDRIGVRIEDGAGAFSMIKHTLLVLIGVFLFGWIRDGNPDRWSALGGAVLAAWFTLVMAAYAVPQLLYRRTKGEWLVPLIPFLRGLAHLARPCTAILEFYQSLIALADDVSSSEEEATPAENVDALISAGTEEGLIEEDDRKLIQSVVEFGDKVVREVMTPRPSICGIRASSRLDELRQLVIHEQYSRIPVYEQNIDQIIGFVHVRDMFELEDDERERRTVRELARPIEFVPETKLVSELMRQMQRENSHMAIVVDEYGNTAGLATMEDLVEVILGEIRDEHEPSSDVAEDGHGGVVVSGSFDVARIGGYFQSFRLSGEIESATVGGLLCEWLGRVPKPGESVERDGIRIDVLASDDQRVEQVRLTKSQIVVPE
jgi:putative hemolysin